MPATVSKIFGEHWCVEKRSLILIVPSVVARLDTIILINPNHPEFLHVETSLHEPVFWDRRLFGTGL
jgi:RES domain-containing protein